MIETMIEFKNIFYAYQAQQMSFDFSINKGEQVTILGPSGAGKSTLLSLIAGFIYPQSGHIILNGQKETYTSPNKRPVSMLFQDNNIFSHLSVEQNLALGLSPSLKLNQKQKALLNTIAERIGLNHYFNVYPHQLSGGQKQRVALGRCLLQHRPILLLDEPFSSLDPKLKKEMFALLAEVQQEYQLTTLMVTHQLDDISETNNRCLVIINGQIAYDGNYFEIEKQADETVISHMGFLV